MIKFRIIAMALACLSALNLCGASKNSCWQYPSEEDQALVRHFLDQPRPACLTIIQRAKIPVASICIGHEGKAYDPLEYLVTVKKDDVTAQTLVEHLKTPVKERHLVAAVAADMPEMVSYFLGKNILLINHRDYMA